eukprot:CCRYP_004877-RA/>CCRYP_004877-RA protein AED:0.21 eAED:-0.28 QI:0/0/0/1/0/0.5/2/0/412
MSENRHPQEKIVTKMASGNAHRGGSRSPFDIQHRHDLLPAYAHTSGHDEHYHSHRPEHLHQPYSCPPRLLEGDTHFNTHPEPRYLQYRYPSPIHSFDHRRDQHSTCHSNDIHEHWKSLGPDFGPGCHRFSHSLYQAHIGKEAFAASCGDYHFPGTTPPQTSDGDEYPRSFDSSRLQINPLPHQPPDEYKPEFTALNPDEGFESPDSNQVYGKCSCESPDQFYDDSKGASVPQSIYLKSDETFTPSPEAAPHNESLMEAAYMAHPSEPPPLPTYHHADSHKSDFGNSSSNSSGHTETCGETGWMKNYNSLIQYWKKNGDCNVPQKYQDENKINLGVWVNKVSRKRAKLTYQQRMERRKLERNKTSSLSPMRLAKLDALGFNWGKEKGQASWDAKYVSTSLCVFSCLADGFTYI